MINEMECENKIKYSTHTQTQNINCRTENVKFKLSIRDNGILYRNIFLNNTAFLNQ